MCERPASPSLQLACRPVSHIHASRIRAVRSLAAQALVELPAVVPDLAGAAIVGASSIFLAPAAAQPSDSASSSGSPAAAGLDQLDMFSSRRLLLLRDGSGACCIAAACCAVTIDTQLRAVHWPWVLAGEIASPGACKCDVGPRWCRCGSGPRCVQERK
jgi:hypothetical protein